MYIPSKVCKGVLTYPLKAVVPRMSEMSSGWLASVIDNSLVLLSPRMALLHGSGCPAGLQSVLLSAVLWFVTGLMVYNPVVDLSHLVHTLSSVVESEYLRQRVVLGKTG